MLVVSGLLFSGPVPIAAATVAATNAGPAAVAAFDDPEPDSDAPTPDAPEFRGPAKPGQNPAPPIHHHRSHHRAPTST
jgi:hypothetical protein